LKLFFQEQTVCCWRFRTPTSGRNTKWSA